MTSEKVVVLFQQEIEEAIGIVNSQKIPAGDWRAAEDILKQSQQTLKLMELKVRSPRNAQKKDVFMVSVNSLRKEIDSLLDDVRRSSLLNRSLNGSDNDPESRRLLEPNGGEKEILMGSQSTLINARSNLAEILETREGIQKNLSLQNDTISSVQGKVNNTNTLANKGRNLLRSFEQAEIRNKLCVYGAVLAVFIGLFVAIYWILFRTT